jgi:hypothetical protein
MATNTTPEHVRLAAQKAQRIAALLHEVRREVSDLEDLYWAQDLNTVNDSPRPDFVELDPRGNITGTKITPAQLVSSVVFTEALGKFLTGQAVTPQNFWSVLRRLVF